MADKESNQKNNAIPPTPRLAVVIPCFNEETVLPLTLPKFIRQLETMVGQSLISRDSFLLFVDDGSNDETWSIINAASSRDNRVQGIQQSTNRGHQNALLAGLLEVRSVIDITISIDCDGQDSIAAMSEMVQRYSEGNEIVYGVRDNRDSDSWFKRVSAESFYLLMKRMGATTVFNHADYRLVSALVLKEFANYHEVNLFLRGLFPLIGFQSAEVFYTRDRRLAGTGHYPLRKMLALAIDGITSLSTRPIRMVTLLGVIVSSLGFIGMLYAIISASVFRVVSGWTSLTCIVSFLGGVQLLCLGVIGEYIGKIYMESKRRPRYIISKTTSNFTTSIRHDVKVEDE